MIRFGGFEVDSARRQLRRDGAVVHLAPKAFDLLSLLVAASPRVVTKAELHERLWPRGAVADATLVALVKELRRALDDRDRHHPVIRTAHRVGYAFEQPIEHVATQPSESSVVTVHWLLGGERRLPLTNGENLVGRTTEAHVWIAHSTVSRRHARIVVAGPEACVEDLDSKNGTSVGGRKVAAPHALRDGDLVRFGDALFTYRRVEPSPATITQIGNSDGASSRL